MAPARRTGTKPDPLAKTPRMRGGGGGMRVEAVAASIPRRVIAGFTRITA
jgi:hypothetical protein